MKILACTDIHGNIGFINRYKEIMRNKNIDAIVCAGDFTIFENHIDSILKKLNSLNIPVFIIHGNHEDEDTLRSINKYFKNIIFIHKRIVEFNGYHFIGWGGGGFSLGDKEFEEWVKKNKNRIKGKKIIFVTHAPPYGCNVDRIVNEHAGNKSFSWFIKRYKPFINICGHLHEDFGKKDFIGKTIVINPGPKGKIVNISVKSR